MPSYLCEQAYFDNVTVQAATKYTALFDETCVDMPNGRLPQNRRGKFLGVSFHPVMSANTKVEAVDFMAFGTAYFTIKINGKSALKGRVADWPAGSVQHFLTEGGNAVASYFSDFQGSVRMAAHPVEQGKNEQVEVEIDLKTALTTSDCDLYVTLYYSVEVAG